MSQDRIRPDRPDFTEGTDIVAKGKLQVESGLIRSRAGRLWSTSLAETLFRYALNERNELRLELPTATWAKRSQTYENGSIGLKYAIPVRDPLSFALIGSATVPSGNVGLGWQPLAMVAAEYELSETLGLGGGLGWESEADEEGKASQWFASLALETRLGANLDGYLEWYGIFSRPNRDLIDAGLIFYANNDLAFDVSFGKWLGEGGKSYFFGVGASWRW